MPRLQAIYPETATGKAKELLDAVQKKYGLTPNLTRTFANSPAVLETYLGFGALDGGSLSPALREQISLAVGEINSCEYCLAAHTSIGKMVGLSEEQILESRNASSADSRDDAALRFAKAVVKKQGWVSNEDLARVRQAGYSDGEIAEIVANAVKNIFTNYFNHVADTEVDFPKAPALAKAKG
jgi:uncharacterized peroxidase-related enzyme